MNRAKISPLEDIDFDELGFASPQDHSKDPIDDDSSPSPSPAPGDQDSPSPQPSPSPDPDPDDDDADDDDIDESPSPSPAPDPGDDDEDDDPSPSPDPDPDESRIVDDVLKVVGFDDINGEEYDDTVEGLGKLVMDAGQKLAEGQINTFFEEMPELGQMFDYLRAGGDPAKYHETFYEAPDYDTVEITDDNTHVQQDLVRRELLDQGYEHEDVDNLLEKYQAGGILKDQAEIALKNLKKRSEARKAELIEKQKQDQKEQIEQVKKYWDQVDQTLQEKDVFKGVAIPKKDKKAFFDYISKPAKPGVSQRDLDLQQSDLETRIMLDYLLFKKADISKIVDNKVQSTRASELKDRVKKEKKKTSTSSSRRAPQKRERPDQVDIDELDLVL